MSQSPQPHSTMAAATVGFNASFAHYFLNMAVTIELENQKFCGFWSLTVVMPFESPSPRWFNVLNSILSFGVLKAEECPFRLHSALATFMIFIALLAVLYCY